MRFRFLFIPLLFLISCEGYKDPAPFTDPRIVNKYCNIPSAINYNWNFPGVPDDSVCVFPAQIYTGTYFYRDSIYNTTGLLLDQDSFYVTFNQVDTTRLQITGLCPGLILTAKANRYYHFNLDSIAGNGQFFCAGTDTIMGGGSKTDLWDTTHIHLNYEVHTDTSILVHSGTAIKQ